jgi:polysaccharide pyruvyl transferase WcaK-like protein
VLRERSARPLPERGFARLRERVRDARFFAARARLFRGYDVVVSAPGPFLCQADPRARLALLDLHAARAVRRPFLFASHSIGPLDERAVARLRAADLIVAREPDSHAYLAQRGIACHDAADLAFLYPFAPPALRADAAPYRLAILRADNLDLARLRVENGALRDGARELLAPAPGPIVLATSDALRDRSALERVAARGLGVAIRVCETVPDLVATIAGASALATDRYHAAVIAAALGTPLAIVAHPGWTKLAGLERLLAAHSLAEIRAKARSGLEAVSARVRAARR